MIIVENFTKVRNDVFLVMYFISGAEVKIFFWIYRQTVGYDKKTDGISISQFSENTGVSETQVKVAIKKLKEKKLIRIKSQKNKNGAKYFNRYEINFETVETLVRKTTKGKAENDQGDSRKTTKGKAENDHTKDNHTKDNITKEEREITLASNVYFSLEEERRDYFLDAFIDYLIDESNVRSEPAFRVKIRKLFAKEDEAQLEEFEKWYLEEECSRLDQKYRKALSPGNGQFYIDSVYPYWRTETYSKKDKLYVWVKDIMTSETKEIYNFLNADLAEAFIQENFKIED